MFVFGGVKRCLGLFRVDCSRLFIVVVFVIRFGCWLVGVVWFSAMLFVGYLLSRWCSLVVMCYVFFVVLLFVASCSLSVVSCSLFVVRFFPMYVAFYLSFVLCCVLLVVCYVLFVVCHLKFRA